MPLVRKAKSSVSVPKAFTVTEQQLYDIIRNALYRAGRVADADSLASAIINLQPDLLEQALLTINVDSVLQTVRDSITAVINNAGALAGQEIQPLIQATPDWGNAYTITGKPKTKFTFDIHNPAADLFAERQAGRLVTAVNDSMRLAIRQIISESFSKQISVPYTAKKLRQVIGLHPRWATAVDKFYDRTYNDLIKKGLKHDKALERTNVLTDRYRQRLIRARSTMIARTEIQIAQNMGRQLAWQQAVDGGWVAGDSMKQWQTVYKNNAGGPACDKCAPLNGVQVRWDMAFDNGLLMPPAHPHCRCTAFLVPPDRGLNDTEWIKTGEMNYLGEQA